MASAALRRIFVVAGVGNGTGGLAFIVVYPF